MINKKTLLYVGIALAYFFVIVNFYLKSDPRAKELDTLLNANPELAAYPYKYRVLQVNDNTAVMAALNSTQVSSVHALEIIDPKLRFKAPNSPEMIKAEHELQHYQKIAAKQIRSQADIKTIRWQIDTAWFTKHGIEIERLCNMHNLAKRYITSQSKAKPRKQSKSHNFLLSSAPVSLQSFSHATSSCPSWATQCGKIHHI